MRHKIQRKAFGPGLKALLAAPLLALILGASPPPQPEPDAGKIAVVVTQMLEQGHFVRIRIDDSMSAQFLKFYLESLDYNHMTFFQSDVDEFQKKYGESLDDETKRGNVKPAFEIFERFMQRLEQKVAFVKAELAQEMRFDSDDSIVIDRRELPWPADEKAAKDLWRTWLKYEVLQERLNKMKPAEINDTITRRYERMLRSYRELDSESIFEIYLTSLGHCYDPHTTYLSQSNLNNFSIQMKLSLVGIGAVLSSEDGYCKIMSIVPGGPADLDKRLKVNDRIVAVGQGDEPMVDVVDMRLQKVVEKIRGEKGTVVRLLVIPADATDPATRVEIKLVRDEIKLTESEAKAKLIEVKDAQGKMHRLGYIDLPSFYADMQVTATSKSTTRDVRRLIEHLKKQNIEGLILDLRRNGGGALNEAINLTGLFIKSGPVVQIKDTAGRIQVGRTQDNVVAYDGPLVILTSHVSASASEILAGALQDYGRAVVVGESSTFGKGTVQSMLEVGRFVPPQNGKQPDWGAVKLTVQKFYRVSGGSTQNKGVVPDVQVPSVLDYRKIGESSLKNAMPYDEVPRAKYDSVDRVNPYIITVLRKLSSDRISRDPEFQYVMEDIAQAKAQLGNPAISLNESKRLAEKQADAQRAEMRKKEREARAQLPPPYQVTEITLEQLDGEKAAQPVAFTKKVMDAAAAQAKTEQEEGAPDSPVDPVFDEGLRVLADLIRLTTVAAR